MNKKISTKSRLFRIRRKWHWKKVNSNGTKNTNKLQPAYPIAKIATSDERYRKHEFFLQNALNNLRNGLDVAHRVEMNAWDSFFDELFALLYSPFRADLEHSSIGLCLVDFPH